MYKVLTLILFVCLFLACKEAFPKTPTRIAAEIEEEFESDSRELRNLKWRTDISMNAAIQLAATHLKKANRYDVADELLLTWEAVYEKSMFKHARGIGDHPPIFQWLSDRYRTIEFILGRDFCINSHIASIHTINHAVPVVFRPCSFPMNDVAGDRKDEYRRHLAKDDQYGYHGLGMEISYWAFYLGCSTVTAGTGFVLVCGIGAGITEKILGTFVLPKMSDRIYTRACGE